MLLNLYFSFAIFSLISWLLVFSSGTTVSKCYCKNNSNPINYNREIRYHISLKIILFTVQMSFPCWTALIMYSFLHIPFRHLLQILYLLPIKVPSLDSLYLYYWWQPLLIHSYCTSYYIKSVNVIWPLIQLFCSALCTLSSGIRFPIKNGEVGSCLA